MAAAPPKKQRKSSDPASKEPRKKTAKTKVPKAPRSDGSTSEELEIFPPESETKQAQESEIDDGFSQSDLRLGAGGNDVRLLQEDLLKSGYELAADGTFGPQTERAVKDFQQKNGLEPTGIADHETRNRLWVTPEEKSEVPSVKLQAVSDRPLAGKEEDALGFAPYVDALVAFLRSQETQPPLAIGINAPWGRGKTSFMKMLESELEKDSGSIKFATNWFNPWKYSNDEQVWAAFVGVITKSVRRALGGWQQFKFEMGRFWNNIRNQLLAFLIRFLAFAAMLVMFLIVALDSDMHQFAYEFVANEWGKDALAALKKAWVGDFIPWLGGILLVHLFYMKVIRQYNISLIDYLKKTNFKDKIGTLSQFEQEMEMLNKAMPQMSKFKVVIFVDDLDRCKPQVLWEVIEALQLLAVSQRCIFVLGMDLKIVANTINKYYPKLSQELTESTGNLQHGWGYKFLEKVIQTRLSVPAYGQIQVNNLINRTLGPEEPVEPNAPKGSEAIEPLADQLEIGAEAGSKQEIPKDSDEVVEKVSKYGSEYFTNPRRLKRFVNNFRLHAYLVNITGFEISLDRLARFLVLAEKWPGLVDFFQSHPKILDSLQKSPKLSKPTEDTDEISLFKSVESLLQDPKINILVRGIDDNYKSDEFINLCEWYGFRYYK